jgi:hypothetical protein
MDLGMAAKMNALKLKEEEMEAKKKRDEEMAREQEK